MPDHDHADYDAPGRPRRLTVVRVKRRPTSGFANVLRGFSLVVWAAVLICMIGGGFLFLLTLREAKSGPQEAAAGAIFSTAFIGMYVAARCVEKLSAAFTRD